MKLILLTATIWTILIYSLTLSFSQHTYFDYSYESDAMIADETPQGLWHLANFDGAHYQNIAQFGYVKKFLAAFFPIFPLLTALVQKISRNFLTSSLTISLLSFFGSLLLFQKIYNKDKFLSVFFLLIFPTSFFFLASYTESLFLLLSLGAWLFASKKRYVFVGILGFLASLTRFYGILLFPVLFLKFYLELPPKKKYKLSSYLPGLPLFLIPAGLLTYMLYLHFTFEDPLLFLHALGLWQKSNIVFPPQTLYRYAKILLTVSPNIYQYWIAALELTSFLFGLLAAFLLWRWKLPAQSLYVALGTTLPILTGTLQSTPRYLLVLFPIYFVIAKLLKKQPKVVQALVFSSMLSLQIILFVNFLQGHFVA